MKRPAIIAFLGLTAAGAATASSLYYFSSHREAPLIADDPTADNTDTYFFVSPENPDRVVVVWNYIPLEEPAGGPNFNKFDDNVHYDIHFDNDGDSLSDVSYSFRFKTIRLDGNTFLTAKGPIANLTDPNFNVRQVYDVYEVNAKGKETRINNVGIPVPPPNIGPTSTPNYTNLFNAAITTLPNGYRVFAGAIEDPFFVDLGAIFDRLTIRSGFGNAGGGKDAVAGYNCHTCVMEIPISELTKDEKTKDQTSEPVIGCWASASRRTTRVLNKKGEAKHSGKFIQVSRLGMPLVNEVVIPLKDKDKFNASQPKDDIQFLSYVTSPETASLLTALYSGAGLTAPTTDRTDLVAVFLTGVQGLNQPANVKPSEMLRLNVNIAPVKPGDVGYSRFGVLGGDLSGFPNGRRMLDDVVDIELRAVAGVLFKNSQGAQPFNISPNNILGDGVDTNDVALPNIFPFVAPPHQGFENQHGK